MIAIAFLASIQLATMAASMEFNTVGMVSVLMYLAIPFGYLLDFIFLDGKFGTLELCGAGLICLVNVGIAGLRIKGVIE